MKRISYSKALKIAGQKIGETIANKPEPSPTMAGLPVSASTQLFNLGGGGASPSRIPLLYQDPLFDQILIIFPQDNLRELNRRLRHYYKYNPYIRSIIDFHTETPLSDFYLNCPQMKEAEEYYNSFKERKNLLDILTNTARDHWLLGEGYAFGQWDMDRQEYLEFVQLPPEEVDVHSTYVSNQKVYVLRPNKEIQKTMRSAQDADGRVSEIVRSTNPEHAKAIMRNKPYPLDSNRLIVLQRSMAGYVNRGVSPVLAVLKDLVYEDQLNLFRTVFMQRHCFSPDTELLTIDGFKNVTELKAGEMFATFNPSNECMEYYPATEMNSFDYDGEMVEFDTQYCQLKVTPEHNMWIRGFPGSNGEARSWEMRHADKVPVGCRLRSVAGWRGIEPVGDVRMGSYVVPIQEFLKLAGFYVSEGCCTEGRTVVISQSERSHDFNESIRDVIKNSPLDIRTYSYKQGTSLNPDYHGVFYKIFDKEIARYMTEQFGRTSLEKRLPTWIKMLPPKYLKIIFDALILGDGSDKISNGVRKIAYYTSSKQLADDVQEIAIKLGYSAIVRTPTNTSSIQKHQRYIVGINLLDGRKRRVGAFPEINRRDQMKRVHYTGKVYCPTIPPHHLVFARRNGRVVITGQSYPLKFYKIGDKEKGWAPPPKMYQEFRVQLEQAINDPDYNIITHPFIQVEHYSGHDKILPLVPQYELVKQRIFAGLFVSEAIISGEKTPYAAGITFMRGLMNRYQTFRNNIENEVVRKIFKPMARYRGFYMPTAADVAHKIKTRRNDDRRLVVPKIYWQKANLLSNQQIQQMIINLRERGEIPFRVLTDVFGWDLDEIQTQLKAEEGTRTDPVWKKVRDKVFTTNNELGRKLLLGDDVDEILKEQIKLGLKEPTSKRGDKSGAPTSEVPEITPGRPAIPSDVTLRPEEVRGEGPVAAGTPGELPERKPRPGEETPGGTAPGGGV